MFLVNQLISVVGEYKIFQKATKTQYSLYSVFVFIFYKDQKIEQFLTI